MPVSWLTITTRRNAQLQAGVKIAMNFAVIQFPGSNCDQDCVAAINGLDGLQAEYVWHKETSLDDFDAIVLPGGFAYGDYLRCGAIARFSPIMKAVISDARAGRQDRRRERRRQADQCSRAPESAHLPWQARQDRR